MLTLRHHKIDLAFAARLMQRSETLLEGRELAVDGEAVLRLAAASTCSAYDCELVSLAISADVPLVTSDRRVLTAFPDVARSPAQFLTA